MTVTQAIDLLLALITQMQRVSNMISTARAEGRDSLTAAELDEIAGANDEARAKLDAAIGQAEAEGR